MRIQLTTLLAVLLVNLTALVAGCSSSSQSCTDIVTTSETSNGTYSYANNGTVDVVYGDIGPTNGLFVVGVGGAVDGDLLSACPEAPSPPLDASAIFVSGNFLDELGDEKTFCFLISGVTASGTTSLGADSIVCIVDDNTWDEACTSVTGTLDTQTFSADCAASQGCVVDIAGTLSASASWRTGSFSVDVALGHRDACE